MSLLEPQLFSIATEGSRGTLLEELQARFPEWSKRKIKSFIEGGGCQVNRIPERFANRSLQGGERVSFFSILPQADSASILHQREGLFFLYKPAGVTTERWEEWSPHPPARPCHRLDKGTSGILLCAEGKELLQGVGHLFRRRKIEKSYLALVIGEVKKNQERLVHFLGPIGSFSGQRIYGVVSEGQEAILEYASLSKREEASLLFCKLYTGRTHQIRVQLASLGHPIIGDGQYGRDLPHPLHEPYPLLHAYRLSLPHPLTGEPLSVEAPLPMRMQRAIQRFHLRKVS